MPQEAATGQPKILLSLPKQLHGMRRFLLWREFPGAKPGKTKKTPFYANGQVRKGLLDTEADLEKLVTLEEALDIFMVGGYSGIGFALTGEGVGAFDLDHILDENGALIETHPGYKLVKKAKRRGAYIEISPSGRGLRIVGPCLNPEVYSHGGLEYWGAKRFVTLTGDCWANPGGWVDLDELRNALAPSVEPRSDYDPDEEIIVTPRTIEELRDALASMESDERDLWVRMGMALKTLGKKGYELWIEWSKTSKKFNQADADDKWSSFAADRTNHKAVFAEAQRNWDWENPRSRKAQNDEPEDDEEDGPSPVDQLDLGDQRLYPTEFILDGFLPAQVSVIAGAWGAGKSTNIIPLMASAAHLAPEKWGFWPTLRRHIVWITEAPEQARDTLYSLAKAEGAADWQGFKDWFHLFPAKRRSPKSIARLAKKLVAQYTYELDNGFVVKPVVVLDTTTANLDLENESDNSQVGAAMNTLKQALPKTPIVLIGHTPKALVKGDVGDMTFRGAGAWEAEAAATYFLVYDQDAEMRFLAIRKARFTPLYREVDFGEEGGSEIIDTEWGEPQVKAFLHGVPMKSDGSARKNKREEAQEERKELLKDKVMTERQTKILEFCKTQAERGRLATRTAIREAVGGKNELLVEATERLVEADLLAPVTLGPEELGMKGGRAYEILLPTDVGLEAFLKKARGGK